MTEYNLFCYSKKYNDENSFQQARYRAFNIEVGKERYNDIFKEVRKIIPNKDKLALTEFWKSITQDQWRQLLAIPEAKDFKEGFEYISGQKIELTPSIELTVKINGKEAKLSDISEETLLKIRNK